MSRVYEIVFGARGSNNKIEEYAYYVHNREHAIESCDKLTMTFNNKERIYLMGMNLEIITPPYIKNDDLLSE